MGGSWGYVKEPKVMGGRQGCWERGRGYGRELEVIRGGRDD